MPKDIIVAIDGYSGCGKSSTAKAVAQALNYTYIDSGAMYRAVTLYLLQHKIDPAHLAEVLNALPQINIRFVTKPNSTPPIYETYLNGDNVEQSIREMSVSERVSEVSAIPQVRHAMVSLQRNMGADKHVVMDGRDIGTNVFPHAELKVFMTADLTERAHRRKAELEAKGSTATLEEIIENLAERDRIDTSRTENPLVKAEDAVEIDTTHLEFDEQVAKVMSLAQEAMEIS
ncbi:(d)CMP kinase [Tunicatimonas pelagia]|uniref:(d)CMP kinase n=1 Tax=Tunicatimonas pelagia TaxID=931531 RepID=UPI0026660223|nr:(d)CMP kinase [Tunicatimonas pelagia]WKN42475.1 (d)CMP kinase [Tunicatimonas pelagia]